MAREFAGVDRGQLLLMPPSLVEWLPEDHLVWTVLGAVDQMDLGCFADRYRLGAAGRAPFDPAVMVALLLYAYARGIRSSRGIERACWEDVAFKVIAGMRTPDHSTIAEFRRRHEVEIGELFDEVLGLCGEAGLGGGSGLRAASAMPAAPSRRRGSGAIAPMVCAGRWRVSRRTSGSSARRTRPTRGGGRRHAIRRGGC